MQKRYSYSAIRERADNLSKLMLKNARVLCSEAGLDPDLLGIHPHNAMCSFHAGNPWRGVNYSKVRATIRQIDRSYRPHRILRDMYMKGLTYFNYEA